MVPVLIIAVLWLGGTMVLESEWMEELLYRHDINRMADRDRTKHHELMRLERKREQPSRSARWAKRNPVTGKVAGKAGGFGQMTW